MDWYYTGNEMKGTGKEFVALGGPGAALEELGMARAALGGRVQSGAPGAAGLPGN